MTSMDTVIRGAQVVTPQGMIRADVGVQDGRISQIGTDIAEAGQEIAAEGLWLLPGGVDVHAHIEQRSGMGLMNADTWETATRSALLGGTTTVIGFAAQEAGAPLRAGVEDYAARAKRGAMIDHAFHMIVRDTDVPGFASDLNGLIAAGHRSVKVFTTYNIQLNMAEIEAVLRACGPLGAHLCVHAEDDAILSKAKADLLARGMTRPAHHALSHPPEAEEKAVAEMCDMARRTGLPVMIFHVSCRGALEIVRAAQAEGLPVLAETCPHYLLMTEAVLEQPGIAGAKWMCSPPQRSAADQDALWKGLEDGVLSLVSSDHAPYRFDSTGKLSAGSNPPFPQIANGMPGLETRMPLMFDAMVHRRGMAPSAFAALTAGNPARLYGLPHKGEIAVGKDADLVLWDPTRDYQYGADDLHDNVGYNPWDGRRVTGWPVTVMQRGVVIAQDGACLAQPGQGQWQPREGYVHD